MGRARVASRVLERVVQVVEARVRRRCVGELAEKPELLVVRDVREVPAQRRHQFRNLSVLIGACDRREQVEGARTGAREFGGHRVRGDGLEGGGHTTSGLGCSVPSRCKASRRSSAGHRPRHDETVDELRGRVDRFLVGTVAGERAERRAEAPLRGRSEHGMIETMPRGVSHASRPNSSASGSVARRGTHGDGGVVHQHRAHCCGDAPPRARSASTMRSSNQPRGRTGGNNVVRWYSRSLAVGHPSGCPCSIQSAKREPGRDREVIVAAPLHQHHVRVECVARPRLRTVDTIGHWSRARGIDRVPHCEAGGPPAGSGGRRRRVSWRTRRRDRADRVGEAPPLLGLFGGAEVEVHLDRSSAAHHRAPGRARWRRSRLHCVVPG